MKWITAVLIISACLGSFAFGEEISVINPKAAFPEGPVWHQDKLFYVEYGAHTVMTWDGKTNSRFWHQEGCGPAAIIPYGSDSFLVTCYDAGTVVKISSDGKTAATYDKAQSGTAFVGPNDFAADKKGGVYFTASGPWESAPIVGKIFYVDSAGAINEVANDIHYANGLALSPDGKTLFCAESEAGRIIQFSVTQSGTLSDRRQFVHLFKIDPDSGGGAYPDGMKIDSQGNMYIGQYSSGRIVVVSPKGERLNVIEVPSKTAPNLNFGPDENVIYVMAVDDTDNAPYYGKVYSIKK
jgi:gluconolactonase